MFANKDFTQLLAIIGNIRHYSHADIFVFIKLLLQERCWVYTLQHTMYFVYISERKYINQIGTNTLHLDS